MQRRAVFMVAAAAVPLAIGAMAMGRSATAESSPTAEQAACAAFASGAPARAAGVIAAQGIATDIRDNVPAHCMVKAVLHPVSGSSIAVVMRLPVHWNGKLLGLGGGGWAGNVTLEAAAPALMKGYATAQTDGGHANADPWNTAWASLADGRPNMVALTDFSERAVHLTAVAAKNIVHAYYGRPQSRAYFQGCSTGGRMALMEAQRFPDDYDGIIAGAPVYTLRTQTTSLIRQNAALHPGQALRPGQIGRIAHAVLAACDMRDGVRDGIIADPASCKWDPATIECPSAGASPDCLSAAQVKVVRQLYDGVRTRDGRVAAYPVARGSESQWLQWFVTTSEAGRGGMTGLRNVLLGDANYDLDHYDPEHEQARLETSAFARLYQADDPDIGRFVARGGKLILWHGLYDAGPSPVGTIDYYRAMAASLKAGRAGGRESAVASHARLFLAPGVGHCRGGPGPDRFDMLGALDAWVDGGTAPERVTASRQNSTMTRPLCPYPQQPRYKGHGNTDDAASFTCG